MFRPGLNRRFSPVIFFRTTRLSIAHPYASPADAPGNEIPAVCCIPCGLRGSVDKMPSNAQQSLKWSAVLPGAPPFPVVSGIRDFDGLEAEMGH